MSKKRVSKKSTTEEIFSSLDVQATKSELFVEKNKNKIIYGIALVVGVFFIFTSYNKYYKEPLEKEAHQELSFATSMLKKDSLDLALNGVGDNLGFLDIVEEYGITKSGNLARYYAGVVFMKKGEYDRAIEYLGDFSSDDKIVYPISRGLIGDAFMELEQFEDALEYYKRAFNDNSNETTTPLYLLKAGKVCMILERNKEALGYFERIKKEFPNSNETYEIDKFILRMKASLN